MNLTKEEIELLELFYFSSFLYAKYQNEYVQYPYSSEMRNKLDRYIKGSKNNLNLKNIQILGIKEGKNSILDKQLIIEKNNIRLKPFVPINFSPRMNLFDEKERSKIEGHL